MNSVRVWTETGETWATSFNGTEAEARRYFLGQTFNIGRAEDPTRDYPVRVVRVSWREHFGGRSPVDLVEVHDTEVIHLGRLEGGWTVPVCGAATGGSTCSWHADEIQATCPECLGAMR